MIPVLNFLVTWNWLPIAAESTTPPGTPPQLKSSVDLPSTPFASKSADTSSPLKRRYVADVADVEIVKKIKQNEIELQDRNTVLRGIKPNVGTAYFSSMPHAQTLSTPCRISPLSVRCMRISSRSLKMHTRAVLHRLLFR